MCLLLISLKKNILVSLFYKYFPIYYFKRFLLFELIIKRNNIIQQIRCDIKNED